MQQAEAKASESVSTRSSFFPQIVEEEIEERKKKQRKKIRLWTKWPLI
jgi:metal-responsive CopG/Arc/MetJ family transcriptional regulator